MLSWSLVVGDYEETRVTDHLHIAGGTHREKGRYLTADTAGGCTVAGYFEVA